MRLIKKGKIVVKNMPKFGPKMGRHEAALLKDLRQKMGKFGNKILDYIAHMKYSEHY
jgi:hypothetical protein